MKFSELEYKRPDAEAVKAQLKALTEKLKAAKNFEEADAAFIEKEKLMSGFDGMNIVSYIRHSIDTRVAFYENEQKYFNQVEPEVEEFAQAFTLAILDSPFKADFEKKYPGPMIKNAEFAVKSFSPEIISELQQENDLAQEYEKLLASAQIPFDGKNYTIAQIMPFKTDADDAVRLAAWKAEGKWFKDNQAQLDELYDKLVKLRDRMGKKLGYGGYIPLAYYRMNRISYTKEDVESFREGVVNYIVPLCEKLCRAKAQRLGFAYPMNFAENALGFRDGNPKPVGTSDEILAHGKKFYEELSPETSVYINEMLDKGMLDILATEGKAAGGYCEDVPDMKMPFIFTNFNGSMDDVDVLTHEGGHAFEDWLNQDKYPREYIYGSMESCEVHSMSMEYFGEQWADDFFGKDAEKYKYMHLFESITFIPYGTMVDHFQHIVFEKPEMTPAERHAVWKELTKTYMPWLRLDGEIPFYSDGESWQYKHHIYSLPFYYIDYCLAQTVAIGFWAMIQDDMKEAWEKYMAYTRQGGTAGFTDLLKNAGLDSPFDPETVKKICRKVEEKLL